MLKKVHIGLLAGLFLALPCYGHPHCSAMNKTISDGEQLCDKVEKIIKTYLPGAHGDSKWKILLEDRNQYLSEQKDYPKQHGGISSMYPPRCHTYLSQHITHCNAPLIREFSAAAISGTLAHEYGHLLCGPKEEDADYCAAYVLRPEGFAHPPHLADFVK